MLTRIVEGKDAERAAALKTTSALIKKARLKTEDITEALADTLEFLPDIGIDSPKAVDHVGTSDISPKIMSYLRISF